MFSLNKCVRHSLVGLFGACLTASLSMQAQAATNSSPIEGTWFNSYCSQVSLHVESAGKITGTYTSHTGSTGSSRVVGYVNTSGYDGNKIGGKSKGQAVALAIQWRLINVQATDPSQHWVSTFSGQYHEAQIISVPGQAYYTIPETLEILNGLYVNQAWPGLAPRSPMFWPQTLKFTKAPPTYCIPIALPTPVPFKGTAVDNISGTWKDAEGNMLILTANIENATVSGSFADGVTGINYVVNGQVDAIPHSGSNVANSGSNNSQLQGLTIAMQSSVNNSVMSAAGGVFLQNTGTMELWVQRLTSTSWIDRFTTTDLDKIELKKQ